MSDDLKSVIEAAWEARDGVNTATKGQVREAVDETLIRKIDDAILTEIGDIAPKP